MEMGSPEPQPKTGLGFLSKLCACHRAVPPFQDVLSSEDHEILLSSIPVYFHWNWRRC